jgi:hypothetical protein
MGGELMKARSILIKIVVPETSEAQATGILMGLLERLDEDDLGPEGYVDITIMPEEEMFEEKSEEGGAYG